MREEIQRVIFLTTVWSPYYEFSTYGVPEYRIAPEDVITESDGQRAISHAEFCLEVSERLHDGKMREFGYDVTDFDLA